MVDVSMSTHLEDYNDLIVNLLVRTVMILLLIVILLLLPPLLQAQEDLVVLITLVMSGCVGVTLMVSEERLAMTYPKTTMERDTKLLLNYLLNF